MQYILEHNEKVISKRFLEGSRDFIQNKSKRDRLNMKKLKHVNTWLGDSKVRCTEFMEGKIKANNKN